MEQEFRRQIGLFDPSRYQDKRVLIVGTGAVGSFTALSLAKMGINNITVYDDDTIESHNLPNQFYPMDSIGNSKVNTLREMIALFTNGQILTNAERFTEQHTINEDYVLVLTDSMESRKIVWEKAKATEGIQYFIDARMGGEFMKIYTVKPYNSLDIEFYESFWHPDSESVNIPCTERSIIYNVLVVAGLVTNQLKKCIVGQMPKREILFDLESVMAVTQP